MTNKKILERIRKVYADNSSDPRLQIKELKKMLKEAQDSGNIYYIGCVFQMLGAAYKMLGDSKNLFTSSIKALTLLQNTDDHKMIANAYITLGVAYSDQENQQMALANYDKAYEIMKKHRIKGLSRMIVMNNLAAVYSAMGDYKSGVYYLKECLEQAKKETPDDGDELLAFSLNLADGLLCDHDAENAAKVLEDAKGWVAETPFKAYACDYHLKYAIAGYELNDKRSANKHADAALKIGAEMPDAYWVYEDFGKILQILIKNNDMKRTEKVIGLISGYGDRNDQTMDRLLVYSSLAAYSRAVGDLDRAVEYYARLEELYKTRTDELKHVQLNIHKSMKEADSSINRLKKIIEESEERAKRDPMTGLLNHSAMLRVGEEFIETALKKKEKIGVIFIDIDFFKECNDTYGHAKGDEIIKKVAGACAPEESDRIHFARYGGDEFLGLTRGLEDSEVTDIARRICDRMRSLDIPNVNNPNGQRVTLSVGVVNVLITDRTDTIQIVNYADKAVYYAKKAGKDCIYLLDYGRTNNEGDDDPFVNIPF